MTEGKWPCYFPQPSDWLKGTVIGSGSFGTVHLAVDTATGSLFVVKSARSDAGIASLDNEADILRSLDSPYIVKCMGRGDKNNLFYEYVGGGSISDLMHKFGGTLPENLIRLYTRQILLGLGYLHQNGVVHSDIKCTNLLLDASGTVKLTDFGCAKKKYSSCKRRTGGTPLWMAPEVLRNQEQDFAADIWSLGCTIIEMATGRQPWGHDYDKADPMAALLKIAEGNEVPDFPRHFSSEGLNFLSRCLDRDPGKRWSSEMLLDHPFLAGLRQRDVALSPTSILDVTAGYDSDVYRSDDDDDDDDDDDEDDELVRRIPFSMKVGLQEKKVLQSKYASEYNSEASDGWITVRKR